MHRASTYAGLWTDGILRALASLIRVRSLNDFRSIFRTLLCPVDLWRYVEFSILLNAFNGASRTLDVGSPKSGAALLSSRTAGAIQSTDIATVPLQEMRLLLRATGRRQLQLLQCDACDLPYRDNTFSFAFSISALEHIGRDGDSVAIAELARVLAPGGRMLITMPLVPAYHEQWNESDPYGTQVRDADGRVLFSRYYDWPSLQARLIEPSRLSVVSTHAWQEVRQGWYARYVQRTAQAASVTSILTKVLDPIWAITCLMPVDGGPAALTRHGIVALLLEKR